MRHRGALNRRCLALLRTALLLLAALLPPVLVAQSPAPRAYLGFDRNGYPGDANLAALRGTFAFTGYWLNNPPGERVNGWRGKRERLERAGFGFLLLFNGRDYAELKAAELKSVANPGPADGAAAARAARAEGFPPGSVIFLDQEQGGRMLPEQRRYIFAWAAAVRRAGYRAGIYCSGIAVTEPDGTRITTASDLHSFPEGSGFVFWIANDACPPSPGCAFPRNPPAPALGGTDFAAVWQFAQSPARPKVAAACLKSYAPDGNCYPPEVPASAGLHLDVSSALEPDPSHARR